jgi:short-subunit dehydrogenase
MFAESYGPWALIAGGSDGIGAAFARAAAARGLNVLPIARRSETLDELSEELRAAYPDIEVRALSQDLADPDAVDQIRQATADLEIGLLIYNVGAETRYGEFLDHDWSFLEGRLRRNFVTKTAMIHHYGRLMRARGRGGMILMGSIAGYSGSPGFGLYGASKAFTHNLSEALWFEFKQHNIDLVSPIAGPTNTPTMVGSYGPLEGDGADPSFIAEGALEHIAQGPIWVADDIREQLGALTAMPPAERAAVTAQATADFARRGPLGR